MKALKIGGWFLLACSVSHCLTGIVSGEFHYPSMRAFWLTVVPVVCLLLSVTLFAILAAVKRTKRKLKKIHRFPVKRNGLCGKRSPFSVSKAGKIAFSPEKR